MFVLPSLAYESPAVPDDTFTCLNQALHDVCVASLAYENPAVPDDTLTWRSYCPV